MPFQEGVISEIYHTSDKSFFQEPQELESLVNTSNVVQNYLPKQADIDKILKVIQGKVLKGTHICTRAGIFNLRTVCEQAIYLGKDVYICFIDYT